MPIHEIRESIEQEKIILDANGFGIVQKVINLQDNMSHKMLQCDVFHDNPLPSSTTAFTAELLVTPTPVIYTDMIINGYQNRAPAAANENILFKETTIFEERGTTLPNKEEFPNRFISARPTFTWYMPKLYITLFLHGSTGDEIDNLAMSVYCAVESKKVSLVTYGMGVIREDHIAQVAAVMANGRSIPPARYVGQAYPMWKYGGVRPEYMMKSDAFADFFVSPSFDSSKTVPTAQLRQFAQLARQMVPNLEAFGTGGNVKGDIPDWVKFHLPMGIESGPIREQWPPTKYADNGNTLTL